jgi:hypothetical protein
MIFNSPVIVKVFTACACIFLIPTQYPLSVSCSMVFNQGDHISVFFFPEPLSWFCHAIIIVSSLYYVLIEYILYSH